MPEFFAALAKSQYPSMPLPAGTYFIRRFSPMKSPQRYVPLWIRLKISKVFDVIILLPARFCFLGVRTPKVTDLQKALAEQLSGDFLACLFPHQCLPAGFDFFFEDIVCGIEMVLNSTQEVHMKSSTLCYSTWWICENHKWCILYIDYYLLCYVIQFQLQFAVAAACCCTCHPCAEPGGFRALTVAARRLVKDLRLWSGFPLGAAALRFIQASSFLIVHNGCRLVKMLQLV